jgi:hypothetical protein
MYVVDGLILVDKHQTAVSIENKIKNKLFSGS